jgi:hypothetical protein
MDPEHKRAWLRGLGEAVLISFVFAGIYSIFLGRFLTGAYSVANFQDNTHFILPLFAYISRKFAAGEFPYWINSIVGGIPLYNTPQFSVLYPFYFFGWNLYRTPLDTSLHVHYVTLLHVAILWLNTYIMMRVFHLRIISSALGATIFAFCANTYAYLFWVNIISPYSWLPLALASVFLILENQYPKTGLVLGWLSVYLLTTASPAQPVIHFAFCSAVLVISYGISHRREWLKLKVPARNLMLLALGSIVLSSPTLVPSMVFAQRDMMRWTPAGVIVGNERLPFDAFREGQTTVRELAKLLFPINVPQVLGDSYFGMLPILLALFGIFRSKQNWLVLPLFCLATFTLLSSTGTNLGFAYINYVIPLWNKIREPARHLYVFALAASTLAAFGFEHLTNRETFRKDNLPSQCLIIGAFLILLFVGWSVRRGYTTLISDSVLIWSLFLFLVILFISRFIPHVDGFSDTILAAIVVGPMLWYPLPILTMRNNDYFTEANLRSHRVLQELAKIRDAAEYRIIVTDNRLNPQYWSMNATYYGLRTFYAFMNPLPSTQSVEMFMTSSFPRYSQLLGAKYYLNCEDAPAPPVGYSLDREIEGCRLYSSRDARPHYFLSVEIQQYSGTKDFFERVERSDAEFSRVSIAGSDMRRVSDWLGVVGQPLIWETLEERQSLNALELRLKTNRSSMLVLNEYFRNDWQASVNGKNQRPFRANLNQIAVLLPEGISDIRFEYKPRLFIELLYGQRIAFALLAMGTIAMAISSLRK